jgi:hypothetical protein
MQNLETFASKNLSEVRRIVIPAKHAILPWFYFLSAVVAHIPNY